MAGWDGAEFTREDGFVMNCGLYEFLVMPFGTVNAPFTFQHLMEQVISLLVPEKCLTYMDDILVVGKTFAEHLNNLEDVFKCLWEAQLKTKPTKYGAEVTYLGHQISSPVPSAKETRLFIGLASSTIGDLCCYLLGHYTI